MTSGGTTSQSGPVGIARTLRDLPGYTRYALLGVFVNHFGAFLQTFLVLYLVNRGFTEADAGVGVGAYAAGAIVGTLAGGWFTDKLGIKLTIVSAVGSASLLTLAVTALSNLPSILAVVFLAGAMTMVSRPAIITLLLRSVPQERQVMVQAMNRTAMNVGATAGPFVAATLSTVNWNLVFYFDAAAAMSYCLIALFLFPRRDQLPPEPGAEPATTEPASSESGTDEPDRSEPAPRSSLAMLRDGRYVGYLLVMLGNGLLHVQFLVVLPLMLDDAGYPTVAYSLALGISSGFVISFELLITKVTQRWPMWVAVLTGWLMMVSATAAFGVFGLVAGLAVLIGASLVSACGQAVGGPAAFAYPARVAPPGMMGRYVGGAISMFRIGYTLGPLIGVALWLQLGRPFWFVAAGFGVLVAVLLVWSMRPPVSRRPGATDRPVGQLVGDKEGDTDD